MRVNVRNLLKKYLTLRALIHTIRFILSHKYRKNYCLLDVPADFYYKIKPVINIIPIPYLLIYRFLIWKRYYISVNNSWNSSVGHLYCEIDLLKRQKILNPKYHGSKILFPSSDRTLLRDLKEVFQEDDFKILIGGLLRFILITTAMRYPSITIDGSVGNDDYIKRHSRLSLFEVYVKKQRKRYNVLRKTRNYHPIKKSIKNEERSINELKRNLNITRPFVLLQIKDQVQNATFIKTDVRRLFPSISWLKEKGFDIVLVGREKCPSILKKFNIINYSESVFATPRNDYLLAVHAKMIISSASGYCNLPETLSKPLLVLDSYHGIQQFGENTFILPLILSFNGLQMTLRQQMEFSFGFRKNRYNNTLTEVGIHHIATADEILQTIRQLVDLIEAPRNHKQIAYFKAANKISERSQSRLNVIPDHYLKKHQEHFCLQRVNVVNLQK